MMLLSDGISFIRQTRSSSDIFQTVVSKMVNVYDSVCIHIIYFINYSSLLCYMYFSYFIIYIFYCMLYGWWFQNVRLLVSLCAVRLNVFMCLSIFDMCLHQLWQCIYLFDIFLLKQSIHLRGCKIPAYSLFWLKLYLCQSCPVFQHPMNEPNFCEQPSTSVVTFL